MNDRFPINLLSMIYCFLSCFSFEEGWIVVAFETEEVQGAIANENAAAFNAFKNRLIELALR